MNTVVVDTNVILVANRQHDAVSEECVTACVSRLNQIVREGRIAIDDAFRILREYQKKTRPHAGKRPGDVFLKWLLRNNCNPARCDQVRLVEHSERGFESFPQDERVVGFDPADRKFVAVAASHAGSPPILQAADSKWLAWAPVLQNHGLAVDFLCDADVRGFREQKRTRKDASR